MPNREVARNGDDYLPSSAQAEQIANRLNRGKPRRPKGYVSNRGKPCHKRKSDLLVDRKICATRPTAAENFNCTAT